MLYYNPTDVPRRTAGERRKRTLLLAVIGSNIDLKLPCDSRARTSGVSRSHRVRPRRDSVPQEALSRVSVRSLFVRPSAWALVMLNGQGGGGGKILARPRDGADKPFVLPTRANTLRSEKALPAKYAHRTRPIQVCAHTGTMNIHARGHATQETSTSRR